jgi:hypothetical protein
VARNFLTADFRWVWLFQGDAVLRGLWCPLP